MFREVVIFRKIKFEHQRKANKTVPSGSSWDGVVAPPPRGVSGTSRGLRAPSCRPPECGWRRPPCGGPRGTRRWAAPPLPTITSTRSPTHRWGPGKINSRPMTHPRLPTSHLTAHNLLSPAPPTLSSNRLLRTHSPPSITPPPSSHGSGGPGRGGGAGVRREVEVWGRAPQEGPRELRLLP